MATVEDARVFKSSKNAKAAVSLKDSEALLLGNDKNWVLADQRGVTIRGSVSFVSTSESIRRGGMWIGLNDFAEQLPSCIVIPLPRNIQFPPYFVMANIGLDLAYFMSHLV